MIAACYFMQLEISSILGINFVKVWLGRTHVCQPDVFSKWKLRSKRENVNKTKSSSFREFRDSYELGLYYDPSWQDEW